MKKAAFLAALMLIARVCIAQEKVEWIVSTPANQWTKQAGLMSSAAAGVPDVEVGLKKTMQTVQGFGTCFNELGWTSLSLLSETDRENILRELFAPGGTRFTICRMPLGANDFSRHWYSYDETPGDFELRNFSIANDLETLVPFIRSALKYNPALQLWASPWSPPSWMKHNRHYAARSVLGNSNFTSEEWGMDLRGINNGLPVDREGKEGTDMFIREEKYFKAYAAYFARFIEAYRQQNIRIGMVMPQNEFNSAQPFPSCTWTAAGLTEFVAQLGPEMQRLGVDVFFGTVERANAGLVDTLLKDPRTRKYIKGVGFQWAGKGAIPAIHQKYPKMTLYQTEQECGNGKNDWKYAVYTWGLMKHYFSNGANAYMYWNTALKQGGISTWGWKQNSLVSVDTVSRTYRYNYDFYVLKHLSHFVDPGAKRLATSGAFADVLAFINPDRSVVVMVYNDSIETKIVRIRAGKKMISPALQPQSFNTFLIR